MRYANTILNIINNSQTHLTAEEIFLILKQQYPSVVLSTVYNNLNALFKKNMIRKVSIEGCPDRYDKNIRHDHLVCTVCGRLSDIFLSDITKQIEQQAGFNIDGYDLKINYICPECKKTTVK